jgi:hypothetical protein
MVNPRIGGADGVGEWVWWRWGRQFGQMLGLGEGNFLTSWFFLYVSKVMDEQPLQI